MKSKWDFPDFWEATTEARYAAASSKIRVRAASAAKMIPAGRQSLSDADKARLFLVHYCSTSHINAVEAAKLIGALDTPTRECGQSETHWPPMGQPFEEVLTGLIHTARNGGSKLAGISICTSYPEAALYFYSPNMNLEGYRYFVGSPVSRFSVQKSFTDVPAQEIQALSAFGFEGFR